MRSLWPAVAGCVLVAACSAAPEGEPQAPEGSGRSDSSDDIRGVFPVGDRELYIDCVGSGSPTIVLEAGDGVLSDAMQPVRDAFEARVRVCRYDRANTGRSSAAPTPRTAAEVVADLSGLLAAADVPQPYVLVGHSAGGMFVQLYGRTYPEAVVGVVAMNPVPPWGPWLERALPAMTESERSEETSYFTAGEGSPESFDFRTCSEQIDALEVPTGVAFHMLISTVAQCGSPTDLCGRTYPAYEQITAEISRQWPGGGFTQAASIHEIYLGDMDAVSDAIDSVL